MSCERYEEMILAYMDGRAAEAQRSEVERHLLACTSCRARVEELSRVWSTLDDAPAPEASPAFDARLRARIAAEPQPSWRDWLPAPRFAFAAAALLAMSVWVGVDSRNTPADLAANGSGASEEVVRAVKDLQTLEDFDVLADFEALSELPRAPQSKL